MTPRVWIFSHRCSWIMVYVFCRNSKSESHSDPHDICTLSLFYQLPNYNLFTQHVLFILWRDTTSELWTPIQFPLHCYTVLLLLALFTFLHTIILLPLNTLNPLHTVICLPNMCYLSYGETPLVNCGPRSNFLYIVTPFYFYSHYLLSCILLSFYHSIHSILCLRQTGEIDNLIISWEQSSWLCCVQVSRCC
jgi:hypothetical protein